MPEQHYWRGMHVPYTTAWSTESVHQPPVVRRIGRCGAGLGYDDEIPVIDRCYEALWVRSGLAQGRGEPDFNRINTHRQKYAMKCSLCQVRGGAAYGWWDDDERTLHLVRTTTPITEGETIAAPPVHPACAAGAIESCPPLRRGYAAALVEYSPLWGSDGSSSAPSPGSISSNGFERG